MELYVSVIVVLHLLAIGVVVGASESHLSKGDGFRLVWSIVLVIWGIWLLLK